MRVMLTTVALAILTMASFATAAAKVDRKLDIPPAGLTPSTVRLADVLAAHERAAGAPLPGAKDTVIEKWTFTDTGISGTETLQRSGTDYRSEIVKGPFTERYGQLGGKRWHQDSNGFTSPATGVEDVSFFAIRVLEDAADPKNDVSVIGETTGDRPAYVLQVKRPGDRHPEWVYYDKASGNIVRVEFVYGRYRNVETYDDFRTTAGITQAWHMHDTDGRTELDDDWHLTDVQRGIALAPEIFAPPADRPSAMVSARGAVPSTFIGDDTIIVRLNVGGRGLDFELDAGEPVSLIERTVAEQLHLPTFGQVTRLNDGTPIGYQTIIPDADL
jgi:hypothetical protein